MTHLPKSTRGHDSVWVIVDRLTKCAHFLPINQKWSMDKLAETYEREVVRLHGVPESIMSDRDRDLPHGFGSPYKQLWVHS